MRKSIIIITAVLLATTSACAQESKVPETVKTAFTQKFPDAKKVSWDMEDPTEWEAEFKLNGTQYSANFSTDGQWKETEHEIKKSKLPDAIQNVLTQDFAGFDIEEAEFSETAEGSVYEVAVEKGEEEWELVFDTSGKLIEKKTIEEDDED